MRQLQLNPFAKPGSMPMKVYGCIAISGPSNELREAARPLLATFNDVDQIPCPDDCGEFPDTTGYTDKNFDQIALTMEDSALYSYMQKCMDAVMSRSDKRYERWCAQYPGKVEKFIHWPKFGGKFFAVAGMVKVYRHAITLIH